MASIQVKLKNGDVVPMSYPDDWSQEQLESAIHENFPDEESDKSEIPSIPLQQGENQKERLREDNIQPMELTLTKALGGKKDADWKGLFSDTIKMMSNALKGASQFAAHTPANIKEIGSEFMQHPLSYPPHVAKQVLAGLVGGTRDLANIPHRIADELADKGITPDWLRTGSIPEDTGLEKFLGFEPKKKSDELLRAISALYGGGQLAAKGISKIKKGFQAPDLKEALRETQNAVNKEIKTAGKIFDKVENQAESRGISQVPIKQDIIKDAESLLPKTDKNKALLDAAKTGDYKALRKLQADLRVRGEKALSSKFKADNDAGERLLEVRDKVNKSIQKHFEDTGHKDLAKELNKAREMYKDIQDTYFSSPALAKVFGKSQKVPRKPVTLLTEESAEMKKFFKEHPEMQKITEDFLSHEGKIKKLKQVLGILGVGGTAGVTQHVLNKK